MTGAQNVDVAREWMTPEIRTALGQIRGQHAIKKRTTVIKVAFAAANQQALKDVFKQADVCSETIWYTKWRHLRTIQAAYEACLERALEWADEQTATVEAHYRRLRRQSVAQFAADAPAAMAAVMTDGEQRGADRVNAADRLMRWAEPETAQKVGDAGGQVEGRSPQMTLAALVGELPDEELAQMLENLETVDEGGPARAVEFEEAETWS